MLGAKLLIFFKIVIKISNSIVFFLFVCFKLHLLEMRETPLTSKHYNSNRSKEFAFIAIYVITLY